MRARVTAAMLDGRSFEHEGLFAPLADRVAFERRFGVSATVLGRVAAMFDEEGNLQPDADPAGLKEEWVAFLVWRVLARKNALGAEVGSFEDFLEAADAIGVEVVKEQADPEVDPTAPPPPTPS